MTTDASSILTLAGDTPIVTTHGHLLGGRVRYSQPTDGFRTGLEPVLLAASVPAKPGDRVLEAGAGAGAALLSLSFRMPGVQTLGVEIDPALAALAAGNARQNHFLDMHVHEGAFEIIGLDGQFDHAIANPPYHAATGSRSPVARRDLAKRGSPTLMSAWIAKLVSALHDRGSLTLTVPAALVPDCLTVLTQSHCPCSAIFPLWPKAARPAKLVLLRGIRLGRAPMRLLPGLVLHEPDGSFTAAAQAILTHGHTLDLS